MTPITVYRTRPLEGILYGMRGAAAQGTVMVTFLFFFGNAVDLYTVLGVDVMSFIFHVTGSNLPHSPISIRYWLFGSLLLPERDGALTFGLKPSEAHASDLIDIYFRPSRDLASVLRRRVGKMRAGMESRAEQEREPIA